MLLVQIGCEASAGARPARPLPPRVLPFGMNSVTAADKVVPLAPAATVVVSPADAAM